ncbi:protein TANC2 isoform X2 [Ischnura elegans]|uniref:protein TANC2 isoform X2 n=1 Tax=Ischnura elegans TaxID=197161 RepID=UPI001ED86F01|nr:protein TANC2 isoform X2 [Ischnura elegans]
MPSGTSAGGGAALSAPVSVVGKRTTGLLLPPSPPTSRPKPQDCESGIGSRTSTLRSVASSSTAVAAASSPPNTSAAFNSTRNHIVPPGDPRVSCVVSVRGSSRRASCPSCGMPFDKAKKRRLIDACGHERCYSCMFANEACPICAASTMIASKEGPRLGRPSPLGAPPAAGNIDIVVLPKAKKVSGNSLSASNASIRASETALYGGREGSRPKMKTNGHFTSYMKSRHHQQPMPSDTVNGDPGQWSSTSSSWRPPKAHPSANRPNHSSSSSSYSSSSAATHSTAICRHLSPDAAATAIRMTQSCPTPPQTRRRFFLSAKALKNPWRQHHQETAPGAADPGGGGVEAKTSSPLNDGSEGASRQGGGPCRNRVSSQSDLHVRLGLLLGDEGSSSSWSPPDTDAGGCQGSRGSGYVDTETCSPDAGSGCRSSLSPPRSREMSSGGVAPHHRRGPSGCSSFLLSSASLVSLDAPRPPHGGADGGASSSRVIATSNNTSPASTLTGSSEADIQCRGGRYIVGNRATPRGLAVTARDRSSDSLASLASLCSSTASPASTNQQQIRRRHSVTTLQPGQVEDVDAFGVRRASIRRSARGGTVADGPTDPKIRFAQFLRRQQQQHDAQRHIPACQQQQLTLRPLFFEVPLPEWDAPRPLFVGRAWLLESIAIHLKLPPLIPSMCSSQTGASSICESAVPSTGTARRSKRQIQGHQMSASSCGQEVNSPTQCIETIGDGSGVAIVGGPGTGKTALLLQLVESSCFGRHREPLCRDVHRCEASGHPEAEEKCCLNLVSEKVQALASHVVAYHFCQAENNSTCLVPDFVHSVAAQLCQAPQLVAYRDLLLSNPELQALLSLPHCIADPDEAIVKGILQPLESIGTPKIDADSLAGSFHQNLSDSYHGESEVLQSSIHGKMQSSYHSSMHGSGHGSQSSDGFSKDMMSSSVGEDGVDRRASCIILVDGLCEAEYHRPDRGPSLGTFLATHSKHFPPWLKLIVTARTRFADTVLAKDLPYTRISLDDILTDDSLQRDLVDYIHFRASHSPTIRANLSLSSLSSTLPSPQQQQTTSPTSSISGMPSAAVAPHGESAAIARFSQHLLRLSGGSFLFTKLTLDLIERGQLVTKSSSYKVLPLTLAQIFLLHFNLRFHTVRAFERVLPILSVVLASLSPPTLLEVFYSVNALRVERFLSWDEFITRFKTLSGFIVKRLDDTYMFFHPAFREWLIRREEGDSTKFLCDPRIGHLGVALRLTRLQCPLEGEALLELGHHILKAHPHRGLTLRWPLCSRDLQASWVAGAAADASRSLATLRNSYAPNVKVSRLLLLAGASPNARLDAPPGDPLICIAAERGDTEVVSLLLEFGADAGAESSRGCIALSLAASAGHEGVVAALLNARGPAAGAGRVDEEGRCPLVLASLGGHMGVVALLLSSDWVVSGSGREISLEEASVQSLVAAAMQGHTELVEYLLDMCNVSPDVVDRLTGETALTASVSYGRHSTAAALLMRGASVTAPNSKGLPPLVAAVSGGGCPRVRRQGTVCSVVELLLQVGGASPEQRDSSGRTALAHAAADGNVTMVRLLLEKGTSVHLEDKEGLSALGWACLNGQVATARVLLDAGAQVQRADASGRTPLHLAAAAPSASQQSSTPLVQLLLERGAVLEGVDAMGLRPLDRAVGTRNISGVHCFLRRGARLGPATWAMAAGKPDVTLILLNKLLEDGNVLYKKGRLQEASHRYRYALKKCPSEEETVAGAGIEGGWAMDDEEDSPIKLRELFDSVRVHLMLNLSRCTRKLGEYSEAVELAEGVLRLRPDSYEAHYARAKAKVDVGDVDGALVDIEEALRVVPSVSREARRVLRRVQEELRAQVYPKVHSTAEREPCLGEDERVTEE